MRRMRRIQPRVRTTIEFDIDVRMALERCATERNTTIVSILEELVREHLKEYFEREEKGKDETEKE